MSEFKILLIDDDDDQEQQLKEAVDNFNKKFFINSVKEILEITDDKQLSKLSILDSKEEVYNQLLEDGNITDEIEEMFKSSITYKTVRKPKEAIVLLYKENFHALIVDLKLETEDNNKEDEDYSGNILLNNIVNKEIIPIIVRTGFPRKISQKINKNIINVYSKETPTLEKVIEELIDCYNTSIFSIFASGGKVDKHIKDFFWDVLPECFTNKKEEIKDLDKEIQEKVVIRYVSSWLNNKYMFDDGYLNVEPIEMYMFPNPIDKICSCDIYEDESSCEKFIVLTPACDLANDKADNIIFAKILSHESVDEIFNQTSQKCSEPNNDMAISKNKRKIIAKYARNGHDKSMRYHFLPKVGFFEGGFIDFSLLMSLKYDKEQKQFEGRNLVKIGTITDAFKRDIIARFGSYYQRQGQPEFNTESILKNHL